MSKKNWAEDWADAIENDNLVEIQWLIDNRSVDINAPLTRHRNASPLLYAIQLNRLQIADLLLRNNANINQIDEFGKTACHNAVSLGVDAAKALTLLLSYHPNLTVKDKRGRTALSLAFFDAKRFGTDAVLVMLIEAGAPIADIDNLSFFASRGTAAIQLLIKHGVIVGDLVDHIGATPLHHAFTDEKFDLSTCNMLLGCGVDLETRDSYGFTCMYAAAYSKNHEALCWLIANGADVYNTPGPNLVMHAVRDYDCATTLLAAGACADNFDHNDKPPIYHAVIHDQKKRVVYALLGAGANIDVADFYLSKRNFTIDEEQVEQARCDIAKKRLDFVRFRALEVCIGLQSLLLPALLTCDILLFACGPVASIISFHHWWKIATTVKHF